MTTRHLLLTLATAAITTLALAAPATAAPGALKIYHYASCGSTPDDQFSKFDTQLRNEPGVASVDTNLAANTLPAASALAPYDLVVVDSYCVLGTTPEVTAFGDALGTFQRDGGVVVAQNWTSWDPAKDAGYAILGDWGVNLAPFLPNQNEPGVENQTVTTFPSSPLFTGISSLISSYSYPTALSANSTGLLYYPNGYVAVGMKGRAVAVNAVAQNSYADSDSQWARLTVNAAKALGRQNVSVSIAGTGKGAVSGTADGQPCTAPCQLTPLPGSAASFTAKAKKGSSFAGWSGGSCARGKSTCAFAVAYPGSALVANFAANKIKPGKLSGTKLSLTLPNAGKLTIAGSGIKQTSKTVKKAGKVSISLKLTSSLKRKIAKNGSASVKLKFAFKPTGAASATKSSKSYKFK
ncbi:MAG: hypothetical protein QM648_00800 [Solirubrobacterales bacterium]